jgi:hypothetical protein
MCLINAHILKPVKFRRPTEEMADVQILSVAKYHILKSCQSPSQNSKSIYLALTNTNGQAVNQMSAQYQLDKFKWCIPYVTSSPSALVTLRK